MAKITFMGAGSSVFVKNILGDCMLNPALQDCEIALYDINKARLEQSHKILEILNQNINSSRAKITSYLGVRQRKAALKGADYIVNSIQVGGYEPATVIDFEIPKKYGLRQTIADTLGIGGIFRALRTIPVVLDFAKDIEQVCPNAWFLNYVNPMAIITGALLKASKVKTVGLCHSVQSCATQLLENVGMSVEGRKIEYLNAGINHMCWLLKITDKGKDLYPEIKKRAEKKNAQALKKGGKKHSDMVRFEMMKHFGYYIAESSEHFAEYLPYWIKSTHPELIEQFNIPLDEYPRRCIDLISKWKEKQKELIDNTKLTHEQSNEYGSQIISAIETNTPFKFWGNVLNNGYISNLPTEAVVEVPCYADSSGIHPAVVGALPTQCAALNMTNINTQLLTIEAALTGKREAIYQAAMLDPHTASELSLSQIKCLCDELIEAHGKYLPAYQ